jgi:PGF-CTERM protein
MASNGVIHVIDSVILPPAAAKVVAAVGSAAGAAGKVEETAKKAESATQKGMPGFESILAIAGLLSVAFIASRRRN